MREHIVPGQTSDRLRVLTDGRNLLTVYVDKNGLVDRIARYAGNGVGKILDAVDIAFDTYCVSEDEPQYWGFQSQEEWDAARLNDSGEKDSIDKILKYVRGEPHNLKPGTIVMEVAEIAKTLVERDHSLLQPENKDKLYDAASIFVRDNIVKCTEPAEVLATALMIVADEDDLPHA